MEKKSPGKMIAALRKQHGMTQLALAEKMGVTDKAVSKWERDLSCPDVNTLPKLAELFHVSMEELMQSAMNQNFIPVVDDLGKFTGIVTRKDIIRYYAGKQQSLVQPSLRKIV